MMLGGTYAKEQTMDNTQWIYTSENASYTRYVAEFELTVWHTAQEDVWQAYVLSEYHAVRRIFPSQAEAQEWCDNEVAKFMQPLIEREAGA